MDKLHEYYLAACKALGETPVPVLEDRSNSDKVSIDAYARLIICIRYKNLKNGKVWFPEYDGSEWHYYVRAIPNKSGFGFSSTNYGCWCAITFVGARLEYRSLELCNEGRIEFERYYIDFFTMPKPKKNAKN